MVSDLNEVHISLNDVVKEFMIQRGEVSNAKEMRYIKLAQSGLKNHLHFDVSGTPQLQRLCPDEYNKSIYYLPSNLVKIRRVFMVTPNGTIDLSMHQSMNPVIDECETPTSTGGNNKKLTVADTFLNHPNQSFLSASEAAKWRGGRNMGGYFGVGGGTVFIYRLNTEENRIEVSDNLYNKNNLFVEYLGLPKKVNGKTMVHPFLEEPLMRWINYAECRFKKNIPVSQKEQAKRDFYEAKHHAKLQFMNTDIKQLIDARRQGFKQSPKY